MIMMLRDDKQAAKDRYLTSAWLLLSVFPAALFIYVVMYG